MCIDIPVLFVSFGTIFIFKMFINTLYVCGVGALKHTSTGLLIIEYFQHFTPLLLKILIQILVYFTFIKTHALQNNKMVKHKASEWKSQTKIMTKLQRPMTYYL